MALIRVKVTPKARVERVLVEDGVVRIWVMAPPVDGEANRAVQVLLAKRLGVAKGKVRLARGESGREKVFLVEGFDSIDAVLGALRVE